MFPQPLGEHRATSVSVLELRDAYFVSGQEWFHWGSCSSEWTEWQLLLLQSKLWLDWGGQRLGEENPSRPRQRQKRVRLHREGKRPETPHMRTACFIVQPFYKRSAQKGQSKQHCMCIKEKQNNSSQSFLCNQSTLKLPLAHVWLLDTYLEYAQLTFAANGQLHIQTFDTIACILNLLGESFHKRHQLPLKEIIVKILDESGIFDKPYNSS